MLLLAIADATLSARTAALSRLDAPEVGRRRCDADANAACKCCCSVGGVDCGYGVVGILTAATGSQDVGWFDGAAFHCSGCKRSNTI